MKIKKGFKDVYTGKDTKRKQGCSFDTERSNGEEFPARVIIESTIVEHQAFVLHLHDHKLLCVDEEQLGEACNIIVSKVPTVAMSLKCGDAKFRMVDHSE
jgi:hypothetical protein